MAYTNSMGFLFRYNNGNTESCFNSPATATITRTVSNSYDNIGGYGISTSGSTQYVGDWGSYEQMETLSGTGLTASYTNPCHYT